jgi:hypothetical protein
MRRMATFLVGLLLLGGCSSNAPSATATASLSPLPDQEVTGQVVSRGDLDKDIVIVGKHDSGFMVTVTITCEVSDARSTALAQIPFQWKDNKLSTVMGEYSMGGGGERPAVRKENDREITIYYPAELEGMRTWAKFRVVVK